MTIPWEKLQQHCLKWAQKSFDVHDGQISIDDIHVITDELDGEPPSDKWLCEFTVYREPSDDELESEKICSRYEWVLESELGEE